MNVHWKKSPPFPYGQGASRWDKGSITAFLHAVASWASANAPRLPSNGCELNIWQRCAAILLADKSHK